MTSTGRDDNMIRECIKPGCIKYFADDDLCPACNDEGKFIMRGNERDSLARRLALALRHAPEKFDLEMDINGWIDIKDIIRQFKRSNERRYHWLRPHHFRAIAETDPKGRYEIRGNVIRATYGHSLEIELDLPTDNIPPSLFYPCSPEEAENLLEVGITPSGRSHVHLSATVRSAAEAGKVPPQQSFNFGGGYCIHGRIRGDGMACRSYRLLGRISAGRILEHTTVR